MRDRSGRSGRRRGSQNPGTPVPDGKVTPSCARTGGVVPMSPDTALSSAVSKIARGTRDGASFGSRLGARFATRLATRLGGSLNCVQPSKVAPQIGCFLLRSPTDIERRNKMTVLVHQIDHCGVIHRVVAVIERHFLGIDAISTERRVIEAWSPVKPCKCGSKFDR